VVELWCTWRARSSTL